eukprot:127511-Chlamydomonas_euryale.AAC.2
MAHHASDADVEPCSTYARHLDASRCRAAAGVLARAAGGLPRVVGSPFRSPVARDSGGGALVWAHGTTTPEGCWLMHSTFLFPLAHTTAFPPLSSARVEEFLCVDLP